MADCITRTLGGACHSDSIPLIERNAVKLALLFCKRAMLVGGDRDLSETLCEMVHSTRYSPTIIWAQGAGFCSEATQALLSNVLDRSTCTRIMTNRVFFTFADRPRVSSSQKRHPWRLLIPDVWLALMPAGLCLHHLLSSKLTACAS